MSSGSAVPRHEVRVRHAGGGCIEHAELLDHERGVSCGVARGREVSREASAGRPGEPKTTTPIRCEGPPGDGELLLGGDVLPSVRRALRTRRPRRRLAPAEPPSRRAGSCFARLHRHERIREELRRADEDVRVVGLLRLVLEQEIERRLAQGHRLVEDRHLHVQLGAGGEIRLVDATPHEVPCADSTARLGPTGAFSISDRELPRDRLPR